MKKLIALVLLLVLVLLGILATGPFQTVHGIRQAIEKQDTAALKQHVDFNALRSSFKAQLEDDLARRMDAESQSNPLSAIAMKLAGGLTDGIVDAMVTPAGIGAVLEGRGMFRRLTGQAPAAAGDSRTTHPDDVLADARYAFQSPSRFTATVPNADGEPVVFVLTREGWRWRLSDIRLPLAGNAAADAGP